MERLHLHQVNQANVNAVRDGEEDKACAEVKSFDYVLPLGTTTIGSVYSKGNGVIAIEWSAVDEADSYTVEYTADGKNWTRADAGNNTEATVSGLTVGTKYTLIGEKKQQYLVKQK